MVGGVSAVLQGVPTSTFDLDIVHARRAKNRHRLLGVLEELEACYREHLQGYSLRRKETSIRTGICCS